jgi:modulator of FtsH protease
MADPRLEPQLRRTNPHAEAVGGIEINRVMRNTYMLLGMTLAFSAFVAFVSMVTGAPYLGFFPTLIGFFGLLFVVHKLADSAWGLLAVFALTGFMGYSLGPLLGIYMSFSQGPAIISQAFA